MGEDPCFILATEFLLRREQRVAAGCDCGASEVVSMYRTGIGCMQRENDDELLDDCFDIFPGMETCTIE